MERIDIDYFKQLLEERKSYKEISEILKNDYPGVRGFSVPSIKLFCKNHGLTNRISQEELNGMVGEAVDEVMYLECFVVRINYSKFTFEYL